MIENKIQEEFLTKKRSLNKFYPKLTIKIN